MSAQILVGDCRTLMPARGPFDLIIADPPYGETALKWDRKVKGWLALASAALKPTGSIWMFGSMRFFLTGGGALDSAGLRYAQDIVWEKHNGSGIHADRFKRVHEHAVHLYRQDASWKGVFNEVQTTPDAVARRVIRRRRPQHFGRVAPSSYETETGGPRIARSVIFMPSPRHLGIHPTEKPSDLLEILIRTSCPPGGLVGDWFAGSGAAGEAALRCGRNYVGCENDAAMAAKAAARLESLLPLGDAA